MSNVPPRRRSIDGISRLPVNHPPQRPHQPVVALPSPPAYARPTSIKPLTTRLSLRKKLSKRALTVAQYMAVAMLAVAAAYSTGIGQWFVLAFAAYVLVRRKDSRLTFAVALFILITIPLFQILQQPGVANNMAVYVFELLILGTIQSLIELKWPRWVVRKE